MALFGIEYWDVLKKKRPNYILLSGESPGIQGKHRLKKKGWKMILHADDIQRKVGVSVLTSDKIDFKTKKVKRDKDGHFIMIKGKIHQEDIRFMNIYTSNL